MLAKQRIYGECVRSSASGVDVCVVAVQRGAEGLSSRDVPFGPGEGAALEGRVEGMLSCAWGVRSVARACVKQV